MEQWLASVFRAHKYINPDQTQRDVEILLATFPSMRPKIDKHSYNGYTRDLMCLYGTLPITFKMNNYNIPVNIWILDVHPKQPPRCLVVPTESMLVKPGRHVDQSGFVFLPYLHAWAQGRSNLVELCQAMVGVFSQDPPVYAKPAGYSSSGGGSVPANLSPRPTHQPQQHFSSLGSSINNSYGGSASMGSFRSAPISPLPMKSDAFDEALVRQSILSAVSEKLRRRVQEYNLAVGKEIDGLMRTKASLVQGESTLRSIFQRMDNETAVVKENIVDLNNRNEQLSLSISSLENEPELNVDEVVISPAPLYTQIFELVAEENALEDAMYYLGKALNNGILNLPAYLKHVRTLARKEFLRRATIRKARLVAGLDANPIYAPVYSGGRSGY